MTSPSQFSGVFGGEESPELTVTAAQSIIDQEIKIIKFRGDPSKMNGVVEVRGIVNKDGSISFGEYT